MVLFMRGMEMKGFRVAVAKELEKVAALISGCEDRVANDSFLTISQVREVCPACAEKMRKAGISRVRVSAIMKNKVAKMTWEQCISDAKKNKDIDDPEKFCGWLYWHGPNAKKHKKNSVIESRHATDSLIVEEITSGRIAVGEKTYTLEMAALLKKFIDEVKKLFPGSPGSKGPYTRGAILPKSLIFNDNDKDKEETRKLKKKLKEILKKYGFRNTGFYIVSKQFPNVFIEPDSFDLAITMRYPKSLENMVKNNFGVWQGQD